MIIQMSLPVVYSVIVEVEHYFWVNSAEESSNLK